MKSEHYTKSNFMIHTLHQILEYSGDQIEKNEIGGACSTYGGEERFLQGFGGKISRKQTTWKNVALGEVGGG